MVVPPKHPWYHHLRKPPCSFPGFYNIQRSLRMLVDFLGYSLAMWFGMTLIYYDRINPATGKAWDLAFLGMENGGGLGRGLWCKMV